MTFRKLFVSAACVAACSSAPTNFAGSYTLTETHNANTCGLPNWTPGSTLTFTAAFTQDGTNAQITVQGVLGGLLKLAVGTDTFQGSVSGNTFTSEYIGASPQSDGACTWTENLDISASLDSNNVISGTITI